MVSPWPAGVQFNDSLNGDTFIVNGVQGVHVDYWDVDEREEGWDTKDCKTWGTNHTALMICLRSSNVTENALVAGTIFIQWVSYLQVWQHALF